MKKNTPYFVVALLTTSLLLSSCARLSNISITKRHYRGGYYVDWGSDKSNRQMTREKIPSSPISLSTSRVAQVEDKNYNSENRTLAALKENPNVSIQSVKPKKQSRHVASNYYTSTNSSYVASETAGETYAPVVSVTEENQSESRNNATDAPFWVIIVFSILIPPLGVGLKFGIVDKFWICLLLTLIFWLPGAIYALIVVTE